MVHINFGPLSVFWCATALAYLGHLQDITRFERPNTSEYMGYMFVELFTSRFVLEKQEQGASQVLRRSAIERNGREVKQFARQGQGKREGWTAWTLRPVGVCVGAIGRLSLLSYLERVSLFGESVLQPSKSKMHPRRNAKG
ncbi:hypothetical protein FSPOR_3334 [Fusarium sporotrichioides]|uniref:Uncharacterized protein n=1 Tax=Fusarium sporotrichioides TaxID=5514 RepID=A0A395SHA1_FUSSP|nr:hypothetical protein FSPOR_3334 [Fusarium sporotrichioides]